MLEGTDTVGNQKTVDTLNDLVSRAPVVVLHIRDPDDPTSRAMEGKLTTLMDDFADDPVHFVAMDKDDPRREILAKFPVREYPYLVFFLGEEVESTISGYHPDRVEREIIHLLEKAEMLGL
jgi:hypothetical protein